MNILIAEDNREIQELTSELIELWGHEYDLAGNGKEAVDLAGKNDGKYDLCLMDIEMPVMNGYEAAKLIRQKLRYFPIMAVTSNFDIEDKYIKVGMDDYLLKPYSINDLYEKIKELTVKAIKMHKTKNKITLIKEIPVNAEQLKELKELEKKDLALLIVEGGQQKFVVHKNIQNKMSHVLIGEGKELFEFLDRSETPANCHLYKCNMQTNRLLLTPEQFEERLKIENSDIEKYSNPADQKISADNPGSEK